MAYSQQFCKKMGPLKALPRDSESLQILHVEGDHWIAVSSVGCNNEEIAIYDSKSMSLSAETKLLLAQLIHTHDSFQSSQEHLTVDYLL